MVILLKLYAVSGRKLLSQQTTEGVETAQRCSDALEHLSAGQARYRIVLVNDHS
jgi:hypothetical protein